MVQGLFVVFSEPMLSDLCIEGGYNEEKIDII